MNTMQTVIACVIGACVADLANDIGGLSYWWAAAMNMALLFLAGYLYRELGNGKGGRGHGA